MARKKSKYLVCIDAYKHSKMALHFACLLAKNNNCPIDLLHVIEPADFQSFHSVADKIREESRQKTEELLNEHAQKAQEWVGITPSLIIREGNIEEEIIGTIKEDSNISMLILGTSPESGTRSKVLPDLVASLHDELVIPMLVVPGNIDEKLIKQLT